MRKSTKPHFSICGLHKIAVMPGRILHLIKEIIGDRGELGLSTKHSWMIGLGGVGAARPSDQLDLVHGLREALKRGRGHAEQPLWPCSRMTALVKSQRASLSCW